MIVITDYVQLSLHFRAHQRKWRQPIRIDLSARSAVTLARAQGSDCRCSALAKAAQVRRRARTNEQPASTHLPKLRNSVAPELPPAAARAIAKKPRTKHLMGKTRTLGHRLQHFFRRYNLPGLRRRATPGGCPKSAATLNSRNNAAAPMAVFTGAPMPSSARSQAMTTELETSRRSIRQLLVGGEVQRKQASFQLTRPPSKP